MVMSTNRPARIIAVDLGRKATKQAKQKYIISSKESIVSLRKA